jgi:predicted nucleic acid-binding protein
LTSEILIPAEALTDAALEIALKHRVTAYKACYLAVATQRQLPLITADETLVRQVVKGANHVQWFGDMQLRSL